MVVAKHDTHSTQLGFHHKQKMAGSTQNGCLYHPVLISQHWGQEGAEREGGGTGQGLGLGAGNVCRTLTLGSEVSFPVNMQKKCHDSPRNMSLAPKPRGQEIKLHERSKQAKGISTHNDQSCL